MATTNRIRFTNNDIEIGVEYGIEWSTPKGTCIIKNANEREIEVEFLGIAIGDYKGILYFEHISVLNQYLKYEFTEKCMESLKQSKVNA